MRSTRFFGSQRPGSIGLLMAFAALLTLLNPAAWAQSVGKIEKLQGSARIVGNQGDRNASLQATVDEGDRIYTEKNSEVVMRMADGAVVAVRPSSSIELTTYQYSNTNSDSAVISLLRGALRKVTGLIGKNNRDNVTVRTATATIGIRGTDFEAIFVDEESQADAQATGAKGVGLGTYTKVYTGGTYLESEGKRVEVEINQTAFAPLDPLKVALQLGLIKGLPGVYRGGKFDNVIPNIQNEALRELRNKLPPQLRNIPIPGAPNGNNNTPDIGDFLRKR